MADNERLPPGPEKVFDRYFTVPITQSMHEQLENAKWRCRVDRTEMARRIFEFFLTMPPDSQERMIRSFDELRRKHGEEQREKRRALKKSRKKKAAAPTPIVEKEKPPLPIPPRKLSGLRE